MAASPTGGRKLGFLNKIFNRSRTFAFGDGSSRRGRREREDASTGKDSSTHSALFDLELSHRSNRSYRGYRLPAVGENTVSSSLPQGLIQRVNYLSRPAAIFEMDLMQDLQALREACSSPDGLVDIFILNEELQRMGYACSVESSEWEGPETSQAPVDHTCLKKLRHTFIACSGRLDGTVHGCIVDPLFRDQFQIAHPTKAYLDLLDLLQPEFVGSQLRLQALADVLCNEIAAAYEQQQLPLPPWRTRSAMMSRWAKIPASIAVKLPNSSDLTILTSPQQPASLSAEKLAIKSPAGGSAQFYDLVQLHTQSLDNESLRDNSPTVNERSNKPRRRQRQMELDLAEQRHASQPTNCTSPFLLAKEDSGSSLDNSGRRVSLLASIAENNSPPVVPGRLSNASEEQRMPVAVVVSAGEQQQPVSLLARTFKGLGGKKGKE